MKIISKILITFVKGYQYIVSPLMGPNCRFEPSCSKYTIQAIEKHGGLAGLWLSGKRILRCNPFGGCGCDPVPDKFHWFQESKEETEVNKR